MQRVHDLPDGEGEDVHAHQQAHRGIQLPGLQGLGEHMEYRSVGVGVLQTPRAKVLGTEASEAAHLPPLLLFLLLCEDRVDPPDLGEHGAVAQAKAQTQEPEAGLGKERGQERTGRGNRWDCARMGQAVGGDR